MVSASNILPFVRPKSAETSTSTTLSSPSPPGEKGSMASRLRNDFVAVVGEFCGTFMFLFMSFAITQIANTPSSDSAAPPSPPEASTVLNISIAFGFSLAVNVWAFFRISGGQFNPAVTLALVLVGAVKPLRGAMIFCAQLVASIAAAGLVVGLYGSPLRVNTTLSDGTGLAQGLFMEAFATAQLVFMVLILAVEKSKTTFLAPIGIGLAVFIGEMATVSRTGGALNPARAFGPSVVAGFETDHWIYWVGPGLASLIALVLYKILKLSVYQTANPGQDFDELESKVFNPPANARTADDVMRPAVLV